MQRDAVLQVVRDSARDVLDADPVTVTESTRLVEDLAVDSLARLEWSMVLEDALDVELDEDSTGALTTIGELVDLLLSRTA